LKKVFSRAQLVWFNYFITLENRKTNIMLWYLLINRTYGNNLSPLIFLSLLLSSLFSWKALIFIKLLKWQSSGFSRRLIGNADHWVYLSPHDRNNLFTWVSNSHRVLIRTYRQICETMGDKLQWIASFINATAHLLTRELHFFRTFIDAIFDRMTFLWCYVPY